MFWPCVQKHRLQVRELVFPVVFLENGNVLTHVMLPTG